MREIKFRAWDKDLKGWIAEKFWVSDGVVWIRRGDMLVKLEAELMQFTGLLDKNGKKIYEGDIVREGAYSSEVKWEDTITGFEPFNIYDADCGIYCVVKECEVIGNIYENPELLNQ